MEKTLIRRVRYGLAAVILAATPWTSTGCESQAEKERERRIETAEEMAEAQAETEAAMRGEHELAQEARGDLAERDVARLAELQRSLAEVEAERARLEERF